MRVKSVFGVGVLAAALALAGCGSSSSPTSTSGTPRVVLMLGGVASDGGFNQAAASAVTALQKKGAITATIKESVASTRDAEALLRQYGNDKVDLVIGWSATFSDPMYQVASEFPGTDFLVTGDDTDKPKTTANVETWTYSGEEFGYLIGWIAGQAQRSPLGIVDGKHLPSQTLKWKGFTEGVHEVNPSAVVQDPVYIDSWEDSQRANQATSAQIDNGAQMIAAGPEGYAPGIIAAAAARGVPTVGMNSTTSDTARRVNIGQARLDMTDILSQVMDRVKSHSFGNRTSTSTIANHSLRLDTITKVAATPGLPDDIQQRADGLAQQLANGKIKIGS
jgi:basic membrane protein A